jgi:KDO2-lipid IV(A) lauroyltransferase
MGQVDNPQERNKEPYDQRPAFLFLLLELILHVIFYTAKSLSRVLPPRILDSIFAAIGSLFFYARPGMRRRLEAKISGALPEITDRREIAHIGRSACVNLFRPMLDGLLFFRHADRIMNNLQIEGMENLDEADAAGKGVILVGCHHGPYSIRLPILVRLGKSYTPIVYHPSYSKVPRYVTTMFTWGQALGCDPDIPVFWTGKDTVRRVREHLDRGKRTYIAIDVSGDRKVEFFGRPAALSDGTAHFALSSGAAIVPYCIVRRGDVLDFKLTVFESIEYESSGDKESDLQDITQKLAWAGERIIKETPEQWMSWFGLWQWWEEAEKLDEEDT